jgi:eukaryotic-like serine/threonine-protein kinase
VNNKVTPERWAQIEELFHRAAESEPASRQELLDQACSNDSELRREVEVLLACDGRVAAKMEASVRSELQFMDFPLSGKIVSHYHIIDGLGSGGMGLVYRARDVKLTREVAIKFLPEASAKDADSLRRFEREARSASALEHANICPIYEFGEHEGQPFIVMPRLEGQTVEQLIHTQAAPKGPQQIQKLFDISIQVLKGLEAAHGHGIVHRDIKPGNIFLTSSGEAKILDFGVAKLTEIEEQIDHYVDSEADTVTLAKGTGLTLSRTGAIVGTAAYMSPEQVRGERIDARTDIFSFGLVLYELATGKRVFAGTTWPVLREAVLRGTPRPVRGVNPEVPLKLEDIINKAIEKDREARYQTAAKMRADLEDLQRQLAPKHLPRAWAVGLGVALAVFVATIFILAKRSPKTISVAPEIKLRQLTTNSGENPVTGGSISPDGKYLAYSDTKGLRIKLIDSGETLTVPQPEGLQNQKVTWEGVAWFPDSAKFLVNARPATEFWNEWSSADTSIWVVSVLGGAPTKVREHAVVWSVSPDGSRVSFGTNKGKRGEREIWLMGSNGEQARQFYGVNDDSAVCCFGWSPDGKRYAYISTDASGDTMLSREIKGGSPITLFQDAELKKMDDIVWVPDGRLVYSLPEATGTTANYWTMRLDLTTGKRLEAPRRLTNWPNFRIYSGSATTDGKRLTFAGASSFVTAYVADLEGAGSRIRNTKHFTLEDGDDYIADWTADSKSVIIAEVRGDHYSLYKQSLDSDIPHPIVSSRTGYVNYAVMTPDGKWAIALIWPTEAGRALEHPSGPLPIVRIPIGGGVPETVLQVSSPSLVSCSRPPSNMCVIAEHSDDHKRMIVSKFDPMSGRGLELGRFELDREVDAFVDNPICAISPDGTRLAITRSPESSVEIHALRGQLMRIIPSRIAGKKIALSWAANGEGFFVTRIGPEGTELFHLDLQGHENRLWRCFGWGCFASPSPDGRHLGILDTKQSTNIWMMENF